ncbi:MULTISPECIES: chaplin [unclassified Streptomyces]|uniref:chaplin n=1 Tax=unclassified Streptomyces TaxID=2593676 RepID=UPI00093A188F|nr:chaplin [Streptomyces sp. TSRI0107]OKJ90777.1 hypothetical protein AMK31_03440 [Streptomyces sp. TSRI0107]
MRITARIVATVAAAGAALALTGTAAVAAETRTPAAVADVCEDGACALGVASGSSGLLSGNVIQVPVDLDLGVCGNSINVIGLLNPATGNSCDEDEEE